MTVFLTDEQLETAHKLGLTRREMEIALVTGIPPEKYAEHRVAIDAETAVWEAKIALIERGDPATGPRTD